MPAREAKYCVKCRAERRRQAKAIYVWHPQYEDYLRAQYHGGLNRRFRVLNWMVRETGLPRWYIKRQAGRLGLTMRMDRRPWTATEMDLLERLVGRVSTATIAKRLHRPETSVVNKLKRMGTSRRVREGYTIRDLGLCLGEDHHKIEGWIRNGWLRDRLQGTSRHDGNGNDIHRIREKDVLSFMKRHPEEINLGKVDQTWFLDLVLLRGRELREVTPAPREAGKSGADRNGCVTGDKIVCHGNVTLLVTNSRKTGEKHEKRRRIGLPLLCELAEFSSVSANSGKF